MLGNTGLPGFEGFGKRAAPGTVLAFLAPGTNGDFMNSSHPTRVDLQAMAAQIMLEHGFEPEFPPAVQQQLADIKARTTTGRCFAFEQCARPAQLALVIN